MVKIVGVDIPFVRSANNYDRNAASDETALDCSVEPSMTQQSFAEECDINTIVRRFGLTGELPQGMPAPTNAEFAEVTDFQSAMNVLVKARESFDALPADVRSRFRNDPAEFVAFCDVPENFDQVEKWGLVLPEASRRVQEERKAVQEAAAQARADELVRARLKDQAGSGLGSQA